MPLPPARLKNVTMESFVGQLARSTPSVARATYLRNQALFAARPDMLAPALTKLPWENALSILSAAYFCHDVPVDAYGAAIRGVVAAQHAGQRVGWEVAFHTLSRARESHGNQVPASQFANCVRSCVQGTSWHAALVATREAERIGMSTRLLLLSAARATATGAAWDKSLVLLAASNTLGSRDKRFSVSASLALLRACASAPWRQTLRLARRKAVVRAIGLGGAHQLLATCLPWHAALAVLPAAAARKHMSAIVAGMPASNVTAMTEVQPPPQALSAAARNALLLKSCASGNWAAAVRFLGGDSGVVPARLLTATLVSLVQANQMGLGAMVAAARARSGVPLPRAGVEAGLVALVGAAAPWSLVLKSFAGLAWGTASLPGPDGRALLSHKALSLLVRHCAEQDAPEEAIRLMGFARRYCGTELDDAERLQATLFCQRYGRWREALVLLSHCDSEARRKRLRGFTKIVLAKADAPSLPDE
jgi:hypothetical protein